MKTLILNLLLIVPVLGWGQSFEEVVDFNIELSSLSNPDVVQNAANEGRVVILEGLLRDFTGEKNDTGTALWITLIGGEWIGTSEVRAYTCRIKFSGDEWLEVFTESAESNADSKRIMPGSRMLIVGRVIGLNSEDQVAELEMVDYRVLK